MDYERIDDSYFGECSQREVTRTVTLIIDVEDNKTTWETPDNAERHFEGSSAIDASKPEIRADYLKVSGEEDDGFTLDLVYVEEFNDPDDYDDSMDGDFDSGMASAGFGTDEDYGFGGDDGGGW